MFASRRTPMLRRVVLRPVEQLRAWPVTSQQQARRNAMIAATEAARRRAEREDVAAFLASITPADVVAPSAEEPACEVCAEESAALGGEQRHTAQR